MFRMEMKILCKFKHKWKYNRFLDASFTNIGYNRWVRTCERCGLMEIEFFWLPTRKHGWMKVVEEPNQIEDPLTRKAYQGRIK